MCSSDLEEEGRKEGRKERKRGRKEGREEGREKENPNGQCKVAIREENQGKMGLQRSSMGVLHKVVGILIEERSMRSFA